MVFPFRASAIFLSARIGPLLRYFSLKPKLATRFHGALVFIQQSYRSRLEIQRFYQILSHGLQNSFDIKTLMICLRPVSEISVSDCAISGSGVAIFNCGASLLGQNGQKIDFIFGEFADVFGVEAQDTQHSAFIHDRHGQN